GEQPLRGAGESSAGTGEFGGGRAPCFACGARRIACSGGPAAGGAAAGAASGGTSGRVAGHRGSGTLRDAGGPGAASPPGPGSSGCRADAGGTSFSGALDETFAPVDCFPGPRLGVPARAGTPDGATKPVGQTFLSAVTPGQTRR